MSQLRILESSAVIRATDIINLEDHLDDLSSQKNLLLLAVQSFNHMLLFHIYNGKEWYY